MKRIFTYLSLCLLITGGCQSTQTSQPSSTTYFPDGKIFISKQTNSDFSNDLHKLIELHFFNNNKEWVELENVTVQLSPEFNGVLISKPEYIESWVELRADTIMNASTKGYHAASLAFAAIGLGALFAEVASNRYTGASDAFLETSDIMSDAAYSSEDDAHRKVKRVLKSEPLEDRLVLPPGQSVRRWVLINTPDKHAPQNIYLSYTGKGMISKNQLESHFVIQ